MEVIIEHKFSTPTPSRSDIEITLTKGGIYQKPVYITEAKTAPKDDTVLVSQRVGSGGSSHINIPVNEIDNFCEQLKKFAKKVDAITKADKE